MCSITGRRGISHLYMMKVTCRGMIWASLGVKMKGSDLMLTGLRMELVALGVTMNWPVFIVDEPVDEDGYLGSEVDVPADDMDESGDGVDVPGGEADVPGDDVDKSGDEETEALYGDASLAPTRLKDDTDEADTVSMSMLVMFRKARNR